MARPPITTQTAQDVKFEHIEAQIEKQEKHNEGHFLMLEEKIDKLDQKLTNQITVLGADLAALKALFSNKLILGGGIFLVMLAGAAVTLFAMLGLNWAGQLTELKGAIGP